MPPRGFGAKGQAFLFSTLFAKLVVVFADGKDDDVWASAS